MGKRKRKLTTAERAAKKRRKAEFQMVFINGKQKRIRRPPTIDAMDVHEFIRRNADHIVAMMQRRGLSPRLLESEDGQGLLFVGTETAPNLEGLRWFLDQVWPRLRATVPAPAIAWIGPAIVRAPSTGTKAERLAALPSSPKSPGFVDTFFWAELY